MKTAKELLDAMQAIVDLADAETRSLDADEIASYEALELELVGVNKTAELHARQGAYRTPIVGFPAVVKPTPKGDAALDFAFEQYLRTGQKNADLADLYAQVEGTDSAGGYLTPSEFRTKLTERLVAFGGLAQVAETIDTGTGNPIEWPTVDDTASTRADIVAEGAASAAGADITFGTKTLGAYRYAATGTGNVPIKVSVELLQDAAFDVAAYVSRALGTRIGRKQAKDLMQASGTGAPQGLMYGGVGTIALAAGDAITYAKLNALVHSVDPAYRQDGNCRWLFNDTTALDIESVVDSTGRPILIPTTQGVSGAVSASSSLLGFPVTIDQASFDKANNVIFAAFGDFREGYVVRRVRDVVVIVNPYSSANTGHVEYNAFARMDGKIQNANAFATVEGTT